MPGRSSGADRRANAERNRPANPGELSPETLIPEAPPVPPSRPEDQDERQARIARRAYELAQQRGFDPGAELDDWLQAEREVDARGVQMRPQDQFTG